MQMQDENMCGCGQLFFFVFNFPKTPKNHQKGWRKMRSCASSSASLTWGREKKRKRERERRVRSLKGWGKTLRSEQKRNEKGVPGTTHTAKEWGCGVSLYKR